MQASGRNRLDVTGLVRPAVIIQDAIEQMRDMPDGALYSELGRMELSPAVTVIVRGDTGAEGGALMSLYRRPHRRCVLAIPQCRDGVDERRHPLRRLHGRDTRRRSERTPARCQHGLYLRLSAKRDRRLMASFGGHVNSNLNRLSLHFDKFPAALQKKLKTTISRHSRIVCARPGGRAGSHRRRAATRAFVDERKNFVRGRVRILATGRAQSIAAAFGALEYGGPGARRSGPVSVGAYRRAGVSVRTYERRRPRIRARRFLRGPAAALRPQIKAQLEAAIGQAINEFDFNTLK